MNKTSVKIDIVSDVVCPWCIVGYRRLQNALATFDDSIDTSIEWHPFELNPNMPKQGQHLVEHVMEKYGSSKAQSDETRSNFVEIGKEIDFDFNFYDDMRIVNTFKAHQLLTYAKEKGLQTELKLALFNAYFSDKKDLSDNKVLLETCQEVGLNKSECEKIILENSFAEKVRTEQKSWLDSGIQSVPAFIINKKYLITGAHESSTFIDTLNKILNK